MEPIMRREELIDALSEKTGYYKKNCKTIVEALADIVLENLQSATFEQDSELTISPGVLICGKRVPEQEAVNPKTGETVIACERVRPYAIFRPSVKNKLKRG